MDKQFDVEAVDAVIAGLRSAMRLVLLSERFKAEGWEPALPSSPLVIEMVEAGLFERRDGRFGFERFKDSFIVPTPLGLAVRERLGRLSTGEG